MKTSTERVKKLRREAKLKKWTRRDYYATGEEHEYLKKQLIEFRRKS